MIQAVQINILAFCYSVLPTVDFVDTFSLNILINPHTETALFIALSTHKPALLRDLSRGNLYIGFLLQRSV